VERTLCAAGNGPIQIEGRRHDFSTEGGGNGRTPRSRKKGYAQCKCMTNSLKGGGRKVKKRNGEKRKWSGGVISVTARIETKHKGKKRSRVQKVSCKLFKGIEEEKTKRNRGEDVGREIRMK